MTTHNLHGGIAELERTWRRQLRRLAAARALWVGVGAVLLAALLDALLALPAGARLGLGLACLLAAPVTAIALVRCRLRAVSRARMLVRQVEAGNPELGNDLINAIEFSEQLAGPGTGPLPGSPALMARHIETASRELGGADTITPLRPASLRREAWVAVGLVAGTAGLGLWLAPVVGVLWPRFADPFGDHPPYSGTTWIVTPGAATVHYGENLQIEARAAGRRPRQVSLVLENLAGRELAVLPMFDAGQGRFFQTIENVREPLRYHVRTAHGRTERHMLSLVDYPRIDTVLVTYQHPAYTHLPNETRLWHDKLVRGYRGTRLGLQIISNKPLRGGTLTVAGQPQPMSPVETNSVAGSFLLASNTSFNAQIEDREGHPSRDRVEGSLELLVDDKPGISIVHPQPVAFALPSAQITVNIEAQDDLGVAGIDLFWNLNHSRDSRRSLAVGSGHDKFVNVLEVIDLADLGVRPGDVLEFYATVTDTLPEAPQSAATPVHKVVVISAEEYRSFIQQEQRAEQLTQKYESLRARIEALADQQERLAKQVEQWRRQAEQGGLSAADRQRLAQAQAQQAALAEQAWQTMAELTEEAERPGIYDVEQDYKETLTEMAQALSAAHQAMGAAARQIQRGAETNAPGPSAEALASARTEQDRALEQLGRLEEKFDKQIGQPSQVIEQAMKLLEDAERFRQLLGHQKDIERQARSLKDQPQLSAADKARLRSLGDQQQTLREELAQLRQDLQKHADEAEKQLPGMAQDARDLADQIKERGIEALMNDAATKLGQVDPGQGHAKARAATDQLEQMCQQCEQAAGRVGRETEQRLRLANVRLGTTLQQLARAFQSRNRNGRGGTGLAGLGTSGSATETGSMPFDLFGTEPPSQPATRSSAAGRRDKRAELQPEAPGALAGSLEEVGTSTQAPLEAAGGSGERLLEQYRKLIEEYFKRAAQETP